jgi:metallo-beta-lactamase class B
MPHANSLDDPLIEPTKIFDNVYAVGSIGTVAYAITTSDGIMLIDALPPQQTESVLLPGLRKLGLDPANIKVAVISHGHADHFGGSIYLQEHYGTHVALTAADWDFMQPRPGAAKGKGPNPIPNRDMIAVEGQPITLGDEKVYPVYTPGHTPGSLGLIFNVTDGGKTHMAGMYGGTLLLPDRPDETAIKQYLASAEHFKAETKKMKVDVELQNHPLMDDVNERLAKVRDRKPGSPNPFIVGEANYQKFLDILTDCLKTRFANRAGS